MVERIAAAELVTLTITEGAYVPGGMLDLLARGIAKRSAPLTVISCDNVPRNGDVLRDVLGDPPDVTFPCTMVDRIVPTPEDPLTVGALTSRLTWLGSRCGEEVSGSGRRSSTRART